MNARVFPSNAIPAGLRWAQMELQFLRHLESTPVLCPGCGTSKIWPAMELCTLSYEPIPGADLGLPTLICAACTQDPKCLEIAKQNLLDHLSKRTPGAQK
jgi:hypothetical protein